MKVAFLFLLISLFIKTSVQADDKDNGGDGVRCYSSTDPDAGPEGLYSLDYILNYQNYNFYEPSSWQDSHKRLMRVFSQTSKYLASRFSDYVKYSENYRDLKQPRIWEKAHFGLTNLNDEDIRRQLPPNCGRTTNNSKHIQLVQLVRRSNTGSQVVYDRDVKNYNELKENPLQYSFLKVHEWLWEIVPSPSIIYRLNAFLHSEEVGKMSKEDFELIFKNITGGKVLDFPIEEGVYQSNGKARLHQCKKLIIKYVERFRARFYTSECKHYTHEEQSMDFSCSYSRTNGSKICTFSYNNLGRNDLENLEKAQLVPFKGGGFKIHKKIFYSDGGIEKHLKFYFKKK